MDTIVTHNIITIITKTPYAIYFKMLINKINNRYLKNKYNFRFTIILL